VSDNRGNATDSLRKMVTVAQDYWKSREDEKMKKDRVAKKNFATLNVCISEMV
jgi:hypothetical protein